MNVSWFIFGMVLLSFGLGGIIGYRFGCDRTLQRTYDVIETLKPKEEQ